MLGFFWIGVITAFWDQLGQFIPVESDSGELVSSGARVSENWYSNDKKSGVLVDLISVTIWDQEGRVKLLSE